MQVKWLLESTVFEDQLFLNALRDTNTTYREIAQYSCFTKPIEELFADDDCVVVRCALETAKYINKKCKWIPGLYCTLQNYECTSYYPAFGDYLLNSNYIMLPYGELLRKRDFLFDKLGKSDTIFIRPNRGDKPFGGQLIYKENYEKDVEYLGFYEVQPDELCVVSEPINIIEEYRFLVVDGKVITGSLYKTNYGQPEILHKNVDEDVMMLSAQGMIDIVKYQPDRAWTLDLCIDKYKDIHVLEINSFSCSGLYACDKVKVIESVNKIALEEYNEYVG